MSVRARNRWAGVGIAMGLAWAAGSAGADVPGVWDALIRVGEHTIPISLELPSVPGREAKISVRGVAMASAPVWDNGEEIRIEFPRHDAKIRATRIGDRLYGEWVRERVVGDTVTTERLEITASRAPDEQASDETPAAPNPVGKTARPLPLRWSSEADECGSAHVYTIRCDSGGAAVARTVSAEGRLINYAGRWSEKEGTLILERFDGEEAEVIIAKREGAGPLVGRVWLGGHMPLPWVVHPITMTAPTGSASASGATIAYP